MIHKTSPTNPKGYAVEPFDLAGPEEHGSPLDAVMHEHELYEIINSADDAPEQAGADTIRKLYFGMFDLQRSTFNELRLRVANVRSVRDAVRTIDVFALLLGHNTVCGADNAASLARKWGVPKETINKPLLELIEKLKLPKLRGQRDESGIQNITAARNKHKKIK